MPTRSIYVSATDDVALYRVAEKKKITIEQYLKDVVHEHIRALLAGKEAPTHDWDRHGIIHIGAGTTHQDPH